MDLPGTSLLSHPLEAEVEVWLVALAGDDRPDEALRACLGPEEREHLGRLTRKEVQDRYGLTRAALRVLLSRRLGQPPEALRFQTNPFGKPALLHPAAALRFNVSHTQSVALIAISGRGEVGVDVERRRPMPEALRLAARFFSEAEHRFLAGLAPALHSEAFLRMWTAKEAYVKAIGAGLSHPIHQVEIRLGDPPDLPVQAVGAQGHAPARMRHAPLESLAGHVSMLVLLESEEPGLSGPR